jgi:hypothetical protein
MLFRRFALFARNLGSKFGNVVKEKLAMLFRRFALFNMRPKNPTEQYEAVVYTINGVHTYCYFDDLTRAHQWITKEYERLRKKDLECAYEIYDHKPNKTRIFVSDEWFLLSEQSPS